MSRVVTPPTSRPSTQVKLPHDKIAARAYEKWVQRGRPNGSSQHQDWFEAEKELYAEFARRQQPAQSRR